MIIGWILLNKAFKLCKDEKCDIKISLKPLINDSQNDQNEYSCHSIIHQSNDEYMSDKDSHVISSISKNSKKYSNASKNKLDYVSQSSNSKVLSQMRETDEKDGRTIKLIKVESRNSGSASMSPKNRPKTRVNKWFKVESWSKFIPFKFWYASKLNISFIV